jgi:transaldolase/glucose-6-phosphate isomerase
VAESKRNTAAILKTRRGPRKEVPVIPLARFDDIDFVSASGVKGMKRRRQVSPAELLTAFLNNVRKEDYLAILCYTERDDRIENRLTSLRALIAQKYGIVVLRGYGPRFLHSTGQLFKGGSQKGHFLVLDREYETDYDIPTMNISFARLIRAQAQGDMKALRKRKRPVIHVSLNLDPVSGLNRLMKLISELQAP